MTAGGSNWLGNREKKKKKNANIVNADAALMKQINTVVRNAGVPTGPRDTLMAAAVSTKIVRKKNRVFSRGFVGGLQDLTS
jgi:hypothetical protein